MWSNSQTNTQMQVDEPDSLLEELREQMRLNVEAEKKKIEQPLLILIRDEDMEEAKVEQAAHPEVAPTTVVEAASPSEVAPAPKKATTTWTQIQKEL